MVHVTEIEDCSSEKVFLGGWKNVVTGKEYHDGASQTHIWNGEKRRCGNVVLATSRVTQTLRTTECKFTTPCRNMTTQTSHLPDLEDKLLTPSSATKMRISDEQRVKAKELFFSQKFSRLEEESAIKIQKFFRACRTRIEISSLARFAVETRTHPPVSEKLVRLSHGNQFKIVERRAPRTRSDFEMLRNLLDRWRILENERIDRTLFGSSRMVAKAMVLLREIELLRSIELAKTEIRNQHRERDNLDYLKILGEPEIWRTRDGKTMEVETLRVTRARKCRAMYSALVRVNGSRVDTLRSLKNLILGHTCERSRELEYLIDQEMNLSYRRIPSEMMDQLRNRVKLAFFQFSLSCCESPEIKFNDIKKFCIRCKKLLPTSSFPDNTKRISSCESCVSLRPNKDPKILYEPYEQMLKDLRKSEARMGSHGGLAFQIGPRVLHHLVNNIWHGKSGISEFDDLFSLRLLRFRSDLEWSPWNSILLTKREAAIHQAMTNPWELYESSLVKRFVLRNLQAKLCFDSLLKD